jgi:hypothetical protein
MKITTSAIGVCSMALVFFLGACGANPAAPAPAAKATLATAPTAMACAPGTKGCCQAGVQAVCPPCATCPGATKAACPPGAGCPASPAAAAVPAGAAVEPPAANTVCPVMDGNPIRKDIFVDYNGKRVFFCCPACIPVFKADPEKYMGKLR